MYERFEQLLQENDLTAYRVGKESGVSQSVLSAWKLGKQEISNRNLYKLAKFFDVSPAWLRGETNERQHPFDEWDEETGIKTVRSLKFIKISILGRVPAGIPLEAIEDVIGTEELDLTKFNPNKDYFGLLVRGESMYPRYFDGDIVIVEKVDNAESGEDVIAIVNGQDATLKRLIKYDNGNIELRALNPIFESKVFTPEEIEELPISICGIVRELRGKVN